MIIYRNAMRTLGRAAMLILERGERGSATVTCIRYDSCFPIFEIDGWRFKVFTDEYSGEYGWDYIEEFAPPGCEWVDPWPTDAQYENGTFEDHPLRTVCNYRPDDDSKFAAAFYARKRGGTVCPSCDCDCGAHFPYCKETR